MRIIIISVVFVYTLGNVEMAVIKSFPDVNGGETPQTPEPTNVRSKNFDPLNDVVEPQLPQDFKEPTTPSSITPKMKRCARVEDLRNGRVSSRLSLSRRDVSERQRQQCETCKNNKLCKSLNVCTHCNFLCRNVNNATSEDSNEELPTQKTEREADQNTIVSSRLKVDDGGTISQPLYYSLGSVEPGPIMRLLVKILNIPSSDNFEKIIILGQLKASKEIPNFHNIVIIDLAQALGSDSNKNVAVVHPFRSPDENAVDLVNEVDQKLTQAMDDKLKTKNDDKLDLDEVNQIIDQTMTQFEPGSRLGMIEDTTTPQESVTRCSSMDEAVEDLLEIIPAPTDYRSHQKPKTKKPEQHIVEPETLYLDDNKSEESEVEIKNPPVIHDNFELVGKNSNDENEGEEAHLGMNEVFDSNDAAVKDDKEKVSKPENQIEENELIGKSEALEQDVQKVVEDSLKEATKQAENEDASAVNSDLLQLKPDHENLPTIQDPNKIAQNLQENILKIVEDGVKIAPPSENLRHDPMDADVKEETPNLVENLLTPKQANSEDVVQTFDIPRTEDVIGKQASRESTENNLEENIMKIVEDSLNNPSSSENLRENLQENEIEENLQAARAEASTDTSETIPQNLKTDVEQLVNDSIKPAPTEQNPVENSKVGAETPTELETRGKFVDNQTSQESLANFGSLIPAASTQVSDPGSKKIYYVGKDINLPLKMYQDENGIIRLRVDTDTLCNCKNKTCTKTHIEDKNLESVVTESLNDMVLPELKVRFQRDNDLLNSFVDTKLEPNQVNSEIYKRSLKVDLNEENEINTQTSTSPVVDEDELRITIQKLDENIEKFNKENSKLLTKGTATLFNEVEETEKVSSVISLANNMLTWMKDFATKRLSS